MRQLSKLPPSPLACRIKHGVSPRPCMDASFAPGHGRPAATTISTVRCIRQNARQGDQGLNFRQPPDAWPLQTVFREMLHGSGQESAVLCGEPGPFWEVMGAGLLRDERHPTRGRFFGCSRRDGPSVVKRQSSRWLAGPIYYPKVSPWRCFEIISQQKGFTCFYEAAYSPNVEAVFLTARQQICPRTI